MPLEREWPNMEAERFMGLASVIVCKGTEIQNNNIRDTYEKANPQRFGRTWDMVRGYREGYLGNSSTKYSSKDIHPSTHQSIKFEINNSIAQKL